MKIVECKSLESFISRLNRHGIRHVKTLGFTAVDNGGPWIRGWNRLTATKWGMDTIYQTIVDGALNVEQRLQLEGYNVSKGRWTPEDIKELREIFKKNG